MVGQWNLAVPASRLYLMALISVATPCQRSDFVVRYSSSLRQSDCPLRSNGGHSNIPWIHFSLLAIASAKSLTLNIVFLLRELIIHG